MPWASAFEWERRAHFSGEFKRSSERKEGREDVRRRREEATQ